MLQINCKKKEILRNIDIIYKENIVESLRLAYIVYLLLLPKHDFSMSDKIIYYK